MPTITQLEYILAVNETKNFSRAAKSCHVSQPSLSAQIQKVEDELDIILFDRSKKPIITTAKGLDVVDQAKAIIKEHKKIFDIKNDSGELKGDLHIAIIPSLAPYLIPLFIKSFSQNHPKVNLKISEYKTEDILSSLYDDSIDAALLVTPLYDDRVIERSLFFEQFLVYTSTKHSLAKKKSVTQKDLDTKSAWLLEEGHCFREQVLKVCSLKKKNRVLKNVNFSSGSLETLINLIRQGSGYTLLPELATSHLPKDEREKQLKKFRKPIPTREVSLVHSRSFLKQDIIDALQETIISSLPKNIKSLKRTNIEVIDI